MPTEPTGSLDRLREGLARKIGPLFQPPAGAADDLTGCRVGCYKLLQRIGTGGFGEVYMAEQEEPVRRRVALKIIKLGMDTVQVIARFEAERQALAMMDHPNIARVFDAGATETGRPYFAMELVKGEAITTYCDRERLSILGRLDLFSQVCNAVQHAHQKAVIHRDIKPSNVLVSTVDGRPLAKVIDFGIAKATDHRLTEKTLFTEFHQMIGTPEYMSPEQAIGLPDIDTRTDIYSLGVLLYELLTGSPPFEPEQIRSAAFAEMQRIIREVQPPIPSARLSGLRLQRRATGRPGHAKREPGVAPWSAEPGDSAVETLAQRRGTDPPALLRTIRGELDWIVMKCLDKDRTRRYETANALAIDVGRYLGGDAVHAAPPSAVYRFRKFVIRHRVSVTSTALVVLALAAGLAAALTGLRAAVRARDAEARAKDTATLAQQAAEESESKALTEAALARATLQFVTDMFESIDPARARGHDVTVSEILDPAADKVAQAFVGHPAAEALVRTVLGRAYTQIARYSQAEREFARAKSLYDLHFAPDDLDALRALHDYGAATLQSGTVEAAIELLTQAYQGRTARLGRRHRDTLASRSLLAMARQIRGDLAVAIAEIRDVAAEQEVALGPSDRDTLESLCSLADMLESAGRVDDALATAHDAAQRAVAAFGPDSSITLTARSVEAKVLDTAGRFGEAAPILREVVAGKERLYGESHPDTLISLDLLGSVLSQWGEQDRSLDIREEIAARARVSLGQRHEMTLSYENNLAQELRRAERLSEAEAIYCHVLAMRQEVSGAQGRETLVVQSNLALLLMQRGAPADALPLLRDALEGFCQALPSDHWMLGVAMMNLGRCQTALHTFEDAEATLRDAHTLLNSALGPTHPRTRLASKALADLYTAWDRPDDARVWMDQP